jgi:L-seryl-tRNA(Ser) seleniumtransferase
MRAMPPTHAKPPETDPARAALLRHLPAIDKLRSHAALHGWPDDTELRTAVCRGAVARVRAAVLAGDLKDANAIARAVEQALQQDGARLQRPSLRRILNGTGVLLHTNAGRAPLPAHALEAMAEVSRGYCNLEISLDSGQRGSRQDHVRTLLCWATGAEDALVVTNGAAAVMLALHALAARREVVVSRGELVEIGGGFRIPEVLTAAGARLHEVGTTNRTHAHDYSTALDEAAAGKRKVAALLQVHRANFAQIGFTATPTTAELAEVARQAGVALVVDVGSGLLAPLRLAGDHGEAATREPVVRQVLAEGADLVTFSGDKLLGGPQAGVIVGRADLVRKLATNPMARAVRVDPWTLAGLEAVLQSHLLGRAEVDLPVLRELALPLAEVQRLAEGWVKHLRQVLGALWHVDAVTAECRPGGGTDPLLLVPSIAISVSLHGVSAPELARRLRQGELPVLGRPDGERVLLEVRSLLAGAGTAETDGVLRELTDVLVQAGQAPGPR